MSRKLKGRKLHRRRPGVFNRNTRRNAILKNIGLVCLALLLIPAGFLAAKFLVEDNPDPNPSGQSACILPTILPLDTGGFSGRPS